MAAAEERALATRAAGSAWLVWAPAAVFFGYAFFQRVAPSVMIDPLMRDLGVGAAVLGNLSAFYFYAYAGLQIPVGMMVDRWGPRAVLTAAAAFCAAGSLVFATAPSVPLIYLGRLMIGAGAAFAFVGTLKLAGTWFPPRRFAQATGLTMMLGMLGGIAGQAPLALAVESTGWRPILGVSGLFGAGLAAAIWLLVRDRPAGAAEPAQGGLRITAALTQVVANPSNYALAFICAAASAPLLAFAGLWGVAWLMQVHGLARPQAAATASLLLIGWALGSPLAGALSDRLARRKPPLLAAMGGGLVCLAALLYLPGLPMPLLLALFFATGLCLGGVAVAFALARELNVAAVSGVALAFVNTAMTASGAVFQPLIGLLLDLHWDGALDAGARLYSPEAYRGALSVLLLVLAAGLLLALRLRESRALVHG